MLPMFISSLEETKYETVYDFHSFKELTKTRENELSFLYVRKEKSTNKVCCELI